MKKVVCMIFIVTTMLTGISCSKKSVPASLEQKAKAVNVVELKKESVPIDLTYTGTVSARDNKKYSFKISGKIEKINVEKGQEIKKGQKLVHLNTQDLSFALEAARSQMASAQAQYDKATNGASSEDLSKAELNVKKSRDAYEYSKEMYEKIKILYAQGATTKDALEKAELDVSIKNSEMNQALEVEKEVRKGPREEDKRALASQLESSRTNYDSKKSMLEDAVIIADSDGFVVDVINKEGEIVSAGYPVVVVRTAQQVINIGLSREDVQKVKVGANAKADVDGEIIEVKVSSIDQIPDKQTWTYSTEIELAENTLVIGSIAKVTIEIQELEGIWIPIGSVLTDGEDYVYVAQGDRAVRKNIQLGSIKGSKVEVKGLEPGDKLVVEGNKRLRNGDLIIANLQWEGK